MCKELKISERMKHLCETSGDSKVWDNGGTAVTKVLHQHDLEIEFSDFNFL